MKKVAILHGYVPPDATKDEQDVLVEVDAVSNALAESGYDPVAVPIFFDTNKIVTDIKKVQPAFIFNLVESIEGLGRFIYIAPTLYDYLDIPYTGARTDAMYVTSNKLLAKQCLKSADIVTPKWTTQHRLEQGHIPRNPPYIIKSVWEHASIGLSANSIIDDIEQLKEALSQRNRDGGTWFAEAFIEGREFNLSVLGGLNGPQVLPPAEMTFPNFPEGKPRIVDYSAKWDETSFEYLHTVRTFNFTQSDKQLLDALSNIATACWHLFELRGYARVDFRVDHENQIPYVLEVNVNPCLSPDAGFFAAAKKAGLSYCQVIERIIEDSIHR